jgi:hypothetical protein
MAKQTTTTGVSVDDGQQVEAVVTSEFGKAASEEAFMHEELVINVAEPLSEEEGRHVVLNVNGTVMPIERGKDVMVKRKYVEVLARCKETRYKQPTRDMGNPEAGNQLIGRTALTYPFAVIEDRNPIGRAWLKAVLAEAA